MHPTPLEQGRGRQDEARAWAAVKKFRTMLPGLSAYASAIVGRKMTVRLAEDGVPKTDGKVIYVMPPMALGDNIPHLRYWCDKRHPETLQQVCKACEIREEILIKVYHEIAHNAFGTFKKPTDRDLMFAVDRAIKNNKSAFAERLQKIWKERNFAETGSLMYLAQMVSPFMPIILNALEDARVDEAMFKARQGTREMFDALIQKTFVIGYEAEDGGENTWDKQPANSQAIIGCFLIAAEYNYQGWLHPKVEEDLNDEKLQALCLKAHKNRSVSNNFALAFDVLARLKELGYCLEDDDQESDEGESDEEPNPEEAGDDEQAQDDDQSESESESDDTSDDSSDDASDEDPSDSDDSGDADADPDQDPEGSEDPQDSGPEDAEDPEDSEVSDGDSGDESDSEGDDSSDEAGDEASEETDSGGDESSDDNDDPSDSDGEDGPPEGDSGSVDSGDEHGLSDSSDDASARPGGDEADGERGDRETSGSPESDSGDSESDADADSEPEDGEVDDQGDGEQSEDIGSDDSTGSDASGEASEESGPEGDSQGDSDGDSRDSGEGEPEGAEDSEDSNSDGEDRQESGDDGDRDSLPEPSDGQSDESPGDDGSEEREGGDGSDPEESDSQNEPLDSGADDGSGGVKVEDLPVGDADDAAEALRVLTGHVDQQPEQDSASKDEIEAIVKAIIQGVYFETGSATVDEVHEFKYDQRGDMGCRGWTDFANFYDPVTVSEAQVGKPLMEMRRALDDNQRASFEKHLTSGRINQRVLGKRAWNKDERLFQKKRVPGKRSYAVLIGIDISGSTVGVNLELAKNAAMLQAELCHRMGIDFAVYAHSANTLFSMEKVGFSMDIFEVKAFNSSWNDSAKTALSDLRSNGGNLDGHTIEYYRKVIEKHSATDKVILYYTDGKMPAANHDEELEILVREIDTCKKKKITLAGVGIRTDSPTRHGLDTVMIQGPEDGVEVIKHLRRHLLLTGR